MTYSKLARFAAIKTFQNVLEFPENMRGKWHHYFQNNKPLVLELACGKGEYTTTLAAQDPNKNYIGVDIKGDRIFVGAQKALREGLNNVCFLRCFIEGLTQYFVAGEVGEIWITFPDPYLRTSRLQKRLTHPRFLHAYAQLLAPHAPVHLKTDSPALIHFTREALRLSGGHIVQDKQYKVGGATDPHDDPRMYIPTRYERQNISGSRHNFYMRFTLPTDKVIACDKKVSERLRVWERERLAGN